MRSDTQAGKGVAGKTAGSRTYAQMDTRGAIQERASITPYNKFTGRYGTGTICDGGPTGSNIAYLKIIKFSAQVQYT